MTIFWSQLIAWMILKCAQDRTRGNGEVTDLRGGTSEKNIARKCNSNVRIRLFQLFLLFQSGVLLVILGVCSFLTQSDLVNLRVELWFPLRWAEGPTGAWSSVRDWTSNCWWSTEVTSSKKSQGKGNRAGHGIQSSKARLVPGWGCDKESQVWTSGPRVRRCRGTKRENQKQGHFKRQGEICDCKEEESHRTAELAACSRLEKYLKSTASAASSQRFYTHLLLTVMTT